MEGRPPVRPTHSRGHRGCRAPTAAHGSLDLAFPAPAAPGSEPPSSHPTQAVWGLPSSALDAWGLLGTAAGGSVALRVKAGPRVPGSPPDLPCLRQERQPHGLALLWSFPPGLQAAPGLLPQGVPDHPLEGCSRPGRPPNSALCCLFSSPPDGQPSLTSSSSFAVSLFLLEDKLRGQGPDSSVHRVGGAHSGTWPRAPTPETCGGGTTRTGP